MTRVSGSGSDSQLRQEIQRRKAIGSFVAGDEGVGIVPNFNYNDKMDLISTTSVGPFLAGVDTTVPLWLAVMLRKRNLC